MSQDLELAISQLAEGFNSLCNEYKALAVRHQSLENRLALANEECEHLRKLVPDDHLQVAKVTSYDHSASDPVCPIQSLEGWIEKLGKKTSSVDQTDSLTRIRDAESACFRIRNRLQGVGCPMNSSSATAPSSRGRSRGGLSRSNSRIGSIVEIPDMEEDFTVHGSKGALGCPFAGGMHGQKAVEQSSSGNKAHMPPTPRSSRSQRDVSRARSKRTSFHDPFKPDVVISPAESVVPEASIADSGPACPIRFLGQHSPEEIAKYFEDHKHELPRSHEICVKRFQDNSDSIKQLDQKYGNLVTMIQGLGQKHRPMMPLEPQPQESDLDSEEEASNQKIKNWARTVSEYVPTKNEPVHVKESAMSEGDKEERIPHFDRPLKEIRVGESPSRPWGVPIPSRFLDRRLSEDEVSEVAVPPAVVEPKELAKEDQLTAVARDEQNAHPKGKCPFDHTKLMPKAPPESEQERSLALDGASSVPIRPRVYNQSGVPTAANTAVETNKAEKPAPQDNKPDEGCIQNSGIAFVAEGEQLRDLRLTNTGTLLIGYDQKAAFDFMHNMQKHGLDERITKQ